MKYEPCRNLLVCFLVQIVSLLVSCKAMIRGYSPLWTNRLLCFMLLLQVLPYKHVHMGFDKWKYGNLVQSLLLIDLKVLN
jgi:hypothetical protein